ncbi:MAG: dipeptidase [Pseudomonadota bacterium]
MEKVLSFIKQNEKRYESEMIEWLKIESVSADPARSAQTRKAAEWLAGRLKNIGIENVKLMETGLHPVVYGDWLHAEGAPTILVYGHYDVQPADPIEKWTTPPFDPAIRDGYIYGRGTADDKGQFCAHLFALEALMKNTGKLPVNVKFFVEGEEECGSLHTSPFVVQNKELLACDAVAVSDTNWHTDEMLTMVYAMRGMCYLQVDVKGPKRDLHSGSFGGMVQNPLNAIGKMIAKLQDENGVIQIPHYYDDVVKLSDAERKEFASIGNHDEEMKKDLSISALWGENGFTSSERNWARPSLDVHGIWGGYSGPGPKTVIASEGGFKVSSRLVANMNPEKTAKQFKDYLTSICPPGVTVNVTVLQSAPPVLVPLDNPFVKAAATALESGFGRRPIMVREGASIPITATFQSELKAAPLLVGFSLPSDVIHSPNERFKLENFHKGIATCAHLYCGLAKVKK